MEKDSYNYNVFTFRFPLMSNIGIHGSLKKTKKMKYAQKHLPSLAATCTNV